MRARVEKAEFSNRVRLVRWVFLSALAIIVAGYWDLQLIHGEEYRQLAFRNSLRRETLDPLRGQIVDRHNRVLAETVPVYELRWSPESASDPAASLVFVTSLLGNELSPDAERWRFSGGERLIAEDLGLDQVARVEASWGNYPDLTVEVGRRRLYRQGPNSAHLIGYLGDPTERDLASRSNLRGVDQLGRTGVERTYDEQLRGQPGERRVIVDSRGRLQDEQSRRSPQTGLKLRLEIDLELQQLAQELLGDRVGVVVAMDPRDGAVRAMVSTPSYDPNIFSRRLNQQAWTELTTAPHNPLQDRAVQSAYSPGSVFKVVSAAAGLGERLITPQSKVYCSGSAVLYGRRTRCWYRPGHGWVNLKSAIEESCDVYFYDLAKQLDIDVLAAYARRFGLGSPTGIDLPTETTGLVPDRSWKRSARKEPWYPGETVSVVIGQGPILTSPVQIARMMAVIATEGDLPTLHLSNQANVDPQSTQLNKEHLRLIREALGAVVEDGTGRSARSELVAIAGKTATVQVVEQVTWTSNEDLRAEHRDHSWFASFAPIDDPQLVVVAFVEHGGAGSQAAAPIARAIHERYFNG